MRLRGTATWLVAAFAIAVGHATWTAVVGPPTPPEYRVEVDGPVFVPPDAGAKNLYLRRDIALAQRPRHAWLQVIARDRLRVYLNGEMLAGVNRDGLPIGVVVDLASHLKVGSNVIALTARQSSAGAAPAVSVRGEYATSDGQVVTIQPDSEWRSATRSEHGWLDSEFDERQWPVATVGNASMRAVMSAPPRAVTTPSMALWIAPANGGRRVALRRAFEVVDEPARGWLRLSSTAAYRLAINGVLLDERETDLGKDEPVTPLRRTYDVTTLLQRGSNVIGILLTPTSGPPRVLADLEVEDRAGSRIQLGTDSDWVSQDTAANWLDPEPDDGAVWQPSRVESGDLDFPPWAMAHQHVPISLPSDVTSRRIAGQIFLTAVLAALAGVVCRAAARWLGPGAFLALLPPTLAVAIGTLAVYDPRVSLDAVYRPVWLVVAGLSIPLQWLLLAGLRSMNRPRQQWFRRVPLEALLIVAIAVAGFSLRLREVNDEPLQWDEVEHYEYTLGFLERGFPSREIHHDLPLAYVHTSELMFVPTALAATVFENPRHVMRLPAVGWSTLSILLIYVVGRRMFTPSAGVVAAAVLALSPVCIAMSGFGRYFAQLQFFTLLVVYGLWLTVRGGGPLNRKALCVTALAFIAMYLTWEGSAFIAVGLTLAAIVYRSGRLRTILLDPAVWIALLVVALALVLQYSHVVLQQTQFLWYGTSLSDLRIRPMWNYPTFHPWFYVWASSWSLDALLPMMAVIAAILLSARHVFRRQLRFLLLVFLTTCVFMTTLLPAVAWRYVHHLVPLLVLLGSAVLVAMAREVVVLPRRALAQPSELRYAHGIAGVLVMTVVAVGSGLTLDLREMSLFRVDGFDPSRYKFPNLENPSRYVGERLRPGDVVLATDPFQVKHYMGLSGQPADPLFFWPASMLQLSATLDDNRPIPLDRRDGTPAIVDLASLERLFARYERIWYVVQPQRHENQNLPEVSTFLRQHMDVVYEDFEAVVLLRDRNHRRASLRYASEEALGFGNRHRTNFPGEPRLPE